MPTEPILAFTMRFYPGDESLAAWLAELSETVSRTDVIRALCYLAAGLDLPPDLRPITERFEGLYVSQAPTTSPPAIYVTVDTSPIADALLLAGASLPKAFPRRGQRMSQ